MSACSTVRGQDQPECVCRVLHRSTEGVVADALNVLTGERLNVNLGEVNIKVLVVATGAD